MQRVEHTRMRRKILYGAHEGLVGERLHKAIGTTRANATRILDTTTNTGSYVASKLAALYREIPEVIPPGGAEDTASAILEAGWWQLAATNQRDTIALNDNLVRVHVDPETRAPTFLLVPPDLVEIVANPIAPSQPLAVKEWIQDPDDRAKWVRIVCDPRSRVYRAESPEGDDVTARVLGAESFSADAYPYLVDGRPVLPYVAYHAYESGYALNPYAGREVWDAVLQLCTYLSFWGHGLLQASWAQTIGIGVRPVGGDVDESGRRREIVADPANMVLFEADEGGGNPQVSKLSASFDPNAIFASIERDERRIIEMALSTAGVSRRDSDVRSAMSLAVSREEQRDAQRAYEPTFRRSDLRLLKLVSGLRGEPTEGWDIRYKAIPRDSVELTAELDRVERLMAMGMVDKVGAYVLLNPGTTRAQAKRALDEIDANAAPAPRLAPSRTERTREQAPDIP